MVIRGFRLSGPTPTLTSERQTLGGGGLWSFRLRAVAVAHGLLVVEDSCDVLDSYQAGRRTGERSHISVTSFARSHAMTAGGNGGLIGVDISDEYDLGLSLRRWGRRSESHLYGSRRGRQHRFSTLADGTSYDLVFVFDVTPEAPSDSAQAQEFLAERGVATRMVWTGNILCQPGFAAIWHRTPAGGLPTATG